MAVTEITKILFRRGRESDRRELENYGGLAQGEPGFTSAGAGPGYGTAVTDTYQVWNIEGSDNIRAAFLNAEDVIDHVNLKYGGGDFFIGGPGGPDVYVGGSSAEKHWQRFFPSLYGTRRNTTYESNTDTEGHGIGTRTATANSNDAADWGYVNGTFHVGKPGVLVGSDASEAESNTKNHFGDQWDVRFYGSKHEHGNSNYVEQPFFEWDANVGKGRFVAGNALKIPSGPLAARPRSDRETDPATERGNVLYGVAESGDVRYNTEWQTFEGYYGGDIGWGSLGGAMSKNRMTYITVDAMGGSDGCYDPDPETDRDPNPEWVAAEENHIHMVVNCEHVMDIDTTNITAKSGVVMQVQNTTDAANVSNIEQGALTVAGGLNVTKKARIRSSAVTTATNAALEVPNGGIWCDKEIYCDSGTEFSGTSASIMTQGGIYAAKKIYSASNTEATSSDAAIRSGGGITAAGKLYVGSTADATTPDTGASIRTLGGAAIKENLHVGKDVVAYSTSDERLKENATPIVDATQKLQQIQGVTFNWSEQSPEHLRRTHDIGVLAQQVEKIVPSAVTTRADGYKAVDYKRLTPLLIASVNQLAQQVQQLTEQVEHLQNNQ